MFEIQGKYNIAKVFTDYVEPSAFTQILDLCNMEEYQDSQIRIMPDVHAGAGCVIGLTMTITDCVSPNFVGVDIGCGVVTAVIEKETIEPIDLPSLDNWIRQNIPTGHGVYSTNKFKNNIDWMVLPKCFDKLYNTSKYYSSLGTLGGGNHFIELSEDEKYYYLQVHSGSRGVGKQVAEYYQSLAEVTTGVIRGDVLDDYMLDMSIMSKYAIENRTIIAERIANEYLNSIFVTFDTMHNYIDGDYILRKGAVKANNKFVIPMNMRDGTLICEAEPLEDWNFSAPHGAGRTMSRSMAKRSLLLEGFEVDMQNIYSSCINLNTLDEAPAAYKPMDKIVENLGSHISIIKHIKPIYNFKG